MRADQEDFIDEAIDWHLRLAEASDADWTEFVSWLEASPAHAIAYDRIAMQDRAMGQVNFPEPVATPGATNDNSRRRWRWGVGASAAAAAFAAVLAPGMLITHSSLYEIATQPGQRRTIALADGTRIEISGGTRLRLDRADTRVATIEQGEATFHVRHDAARPFAVTAGAITIRDMGTVFNVARDSGRVSIAVAEGSVMFRPDREAMTLNAGDALTADEAGGRVSRSRISLDSIGGWRSGMLSFDGQPLAAVAARLNRLYAINLRLESGLAERPFTGMVHFTGAANRDVPHLATLIGASWRREGDRWILSSGAPASH